MRRPCSRWLHGFLAGGGKENKMRKFWIFILVSFGLGWLLQALGMLSLSIDAAGLLYTGLLAVSMFAPLAAVWIACGGLKKEKSGLEWKPVIRGRGRFWLSAWFGPIVVAILGALVFFLVFPGRFDGSMPVIAQALYEQGSPLPAWVLLAVALVQCLSYAPFLNMLFALGEEAGWRGFMTPFLTEKLGRTKGLVLSGVIWGAWHWPIILLAGYNFGSGYWGAPFTGALLMCLSCTALGILLSLLCEKCGSVWAPALAHGAFNACAGLGVYFLTAEFSGNTFLGPTPLGLVAGIPLYILAALVLFRRKKGE